MRFLLSILVLAFTSTLAADLPTFPIVQIDQFGNGVAVWQETAENGNSQIYSSTLNASSDTWSTSVQLSDSSYDNFNPMLKMNAAGNAVALWEEAIGNRVLIAATYTVGGTWSSPTMLSSTDQLLTDNFSVVINPSGTAIAVWCVNLTADSTLNYSSTIILGGSWTTPISMPDPNPPSSPAHAKVKKQAEVKKQTDKKKKPALLTGFQQLLNMIF